jgi:hypothetical protein
VLSEGLATILLLPLAAGEPAGGAEPLQVAIATLGAAITTAALLLLGQGHRSGRISVLARAAAACERASGLPGWAALPSAVAAVALNVALLGMYWDISLHIDQGRDAGPLANPAHYLILAGLFGIFASGVLAMVLPLGERPGPAALRISGDWFAPVGGVLMAVCGAFALIAFPLDDFSHRLFGQDVTLWGPTHLMLIGGAGLSLIGQAVLLAEGMRARPSRTTGNGNAITVMRRAGLMGGLLIGLSTFQAEFDFGVPQYRLLFQPLLIAGAAGIALVAARIWIGRGGALAAALFYLITRGAVSLIVGPVLGETMPALPLYLPEALCIEMAALFLARRPLVLGAVGGALVGTAGFAGEWGWTQVAMRLPWTADLLPEALLLAITVGIAGGALGALLALGLRGELPRPAVARSVGGVAVAVIAACMAFGFPTTVPDRATATVTLDDVRGGSEREANATVAIDPPSLADDAAWVTVTAWQGGGLHVDRLDRVGDGVYRTNEPIPVHGSWKSLVRVQHGDQVLGVPIFMPADPAIPAAEVSAPARFVRTFDHDSRILQRERDFGVPGWLWGSGLAVVLGLFAILIGTLAWGLGRVARREGDAPPPPGRPAERKAPGYVAEPVSV